MKLRFIYFTETGYTINTNYLVSISLVRRGIFFIHWYNGDKTRIDVEYPDKVRGDLLSFLLSDEGKIYTIDNK